MSLAELAVIEYLNTCGFEPFNKRRQNPLLPTIYVPEREIKPLSMRGFDKYEEHGGVDLVLLSPRTSIKRHTSAIDLSAPNKWSIKNIGLVYLTFDNGPLDFSEIKIIPNSSTFKYLRANESSLFQAKPNIFLKCLGGFFSNCPAYSS